MEKGLRRRDLLKFAAGAVASSALQPVASAFGADDKRAGRFRKLGRTGLKVSMVSFGAMLTPEPEVITAAIDMGVNYIDTARVYMGGTNEEIVGTAIKGKRDKVYIATKTRASSVTAKDIVKDVETSLTKLKTDYIDVIQLHNLTDRERIYHTEVREALVRLKGQGKVRFFGVTTHRNQVDVVNGLLEDRDRFFDVLLITYNFKSPSEIRDVIARAAKADIGIVAMKTQAGGYKTKELGEISPHQAALKWALLNKDIATAIPGMKDMAEMREDLAVMDMKFTDYDRKVLGLYAEAIDGDYCRMCSGCEQTCPSSVAISSVNRAIMYLEGYGDYSLASAAFKEINRRESIAQCSNCDVCVARCRFGIDIASKIKKAKGYFA